MSEDPNPSWWKKIWILEFSFFEDHYVEQPCCCSRIVINVQPCHSTMVYIYYAKTWLFVKFDSITWLKNGISDKSNSTICFSWTLRHCMSDYLVYVIIGFWVGVLRVVFLWCIGNMFFVCIFFFTLFFSIDGVWFNMGFVKLLSYSWTTNITPSSIATCKWLLCLLHLHLLNHYKIFH